MQRVAKLTTAERAMLVIGSAAAVLCLYGVIVLIGAWSA